MEEISGRFPNIEGDDWVVPEKIHTSPTDGILEIFAGGGIKDSRNPGGRGGVELKKVFCRGHFNR